MAEDVSRDWDDLPGTHWSKIEAAADVTSEKGSAALETLLTLYRPPLLQHLRTKFRLAPSDAEDLLHAFIHRKILENNLFARADRHRGRFRTYIFTVLDRFAISELRRFGAQKRTLLHNAIPLDALGEEELPAAGSPSDSLDDFNWARVVIAGALLNMEHHCQVSDRPQTWAIFLARELLPLLTDVEPEPYDDLIERHRLDSPASAFNLLSTAKRMFRREIHRVLEDFAEDEEEIREELEHLRRYLDRLLRSN